MRGAQDKIKRRIRIRGKQALIRKVDEEEDLKTHGGLKEGVWMKTYLDGPIDSAKNRKVRFWVRGLDLPETRRSYTSSWVERRKEMHRIAPVIDENMLIEHESYV